MDITKTAPSQSFLGQELKNNATPVLSPFTFFLPAQAGPPLADTLYLLLSTFYQYHYLMRLFIAVPLPKTVRDSIDAYIYEAEQKVSASWANAKNLHLTLAFLGDIPEEQLPAIQSAMDAIAETPAFTLDLDTVGCFPDQRLPRIIWLGPSHPPYDMGQLAKSLREKLARQHIPFDNKPFIPHITIARDPVNPTLGIPLQIPDFTENLEVPIDEIMLFESRLTQPEATYVTMYRTRLG